MADHESWYRGYVAPQSDHRSNVPPPPPWPSADHPMQRGEVAPPARHLADHPMTMTDRSFPGQDAPEDLDSVASELAFQMEQRQAFRKQFTKTQFCRYHWGGGCRKGANCQFAHEAHELTRPPDLRRTSICKDWLEGKCGATAETCRFAHGNAFLRRTIENDAAAGYRPPPPSSSSSEFMSAPGSRARGLQGGAAKLFTNWEQQLLRQQVEQQEMKETIKSQQRIIDSLIGLQASGATPSIEPEAPGPATLVQQPAGGPALHQMSTNKIQSHAASFQEMRTMFQRLPEFLPSANSQGGFPTDAIYARQQASQGIPF